jgi:hypothetical protein
VYEWASLGVLVAVKWSSLASLRVVVAVEWSSLVAVVVVVPSVYEWASLGVVVAAVERLSSVLTTAHYSLLVNCLYVFRLEWRTAHDECVEDNSNRPSIDLKTVSIGGIKKNFWSNIIWRAANGLFPLAGILNEGSQSEITDFDIHIRIQE